MFYRKNVGGKERMARLAAGGLMIFFGVVWLQASLPGLLLAASGGVAVLTGMIGYCPACAMAGRKAIDNRS